ncbi:hypothetical protein K474DRAFT_1514337 [Panus rudis PR-1116 ss-1]|nr:hypothetical protein K474DRAFT_1514337 [Panus rudis PR-1116 ss-1]
MSKRRWREAQRIVCRSIHLQSDPAEWFHNHTSSFLPHSLCQNIQSRPSSILSTIAFICTLTWASRYVASLSRFLNWVGVEFECHSRVSSRYQCARESRMCPWLSTIRKRELTIR